MSLRWWPLLLVVPLALVACGGEKAKAPEPSATAVVAQPSSTPRPTPSPTASPEPALPSPTAFPTLPPTAGPEPTEVAPTTTPEATPAAPEHLLGVFVVPADGSGQPVKVAEDGFVVGWSPDGTLIALSTLDPDQSGCGIAPATCFHELSLIRADGQGQPIALGDAQFPRWSVQENRVLFYRFARGPLTTASGQTFTGIVAKEVCVTDAASGQTTVLASNGPITKVEGNTVGRVGDIGDRPMWSPDESRVLFGFGEQGAQILYVVKADGSGPPEKLADGGEADWSPDGEHVVYSWGGQIYTVRADGSEPPRQAAAGREPEWSPDGSLIAFRVGEYGELSTAAPEIWLLNVETGETTKLVDGWPPEWSPDGSLVLYRTKEGGIHIVSAEGGAASARLGEGDSARLVARREACRFPEDGGGVRKRRRRLPAPCGQRRR